MNLKQKRIIFSNLLSQVVLWASQQGWDLAYDEVKVFKHRKGYSAHSSVKEEYVDGVHIPRSLHYDGLAADLNLYIQGEYISGDHPAWQSIGKKWKAMHPLCTWGGDFTHKDFNHLSFGE